MAWQVKCKVLDGRVTHEATETNNYRLQCESRKIPPGDFLTFFPKWLGFFSPNFTCLLYIPIYARLQVFIQLPAALTKLCHIKRDHHDMLKMPTIDRNAPWVA